jgi:hypothetical protein
MVIIWDKQPDRINLPLPVEALEPLEEDAAVEAIIAEAEQSTELAKEVEAARGFHKGFGS